MSRNCGKMGRTLLSLIEVPPISLFPFPIPLKNVPHKILIFAHLK